MKSKEALERIKSRTIPYYLGLYEKEDYLEDLKIIEKDLKILYILKNYIVINFEDEDEQYLSFDRYICGNDIDTEDDFYKIKGWLREDD